MDDKKQINITIFKEKTDMGHLYTVYDEHGDKIVETKPLSYALKSLKQILWDW
jgi:hypothetical protein